MERMWLAIRSAVDSMRSRRSMASEESLPRCVSRRTAALRATVDRGGCRSWLATAGDSRRAALGALRPGVGAVGALEEWVDRGRRGGDRAGPGPPAAPPRLVAHRLHAVRQAL